MSPVATHSTPSNAVYTASGTSSLDTNRTMRSSSVYSRAQWNRATRITTLTTASTTKIMAKATLPAWRACAGRPAPSSLLLRVSTATLNPTGTMKARALVTWKMETPATLSSGLGSQPAMMMFASEAHHSAIMRIPGIARRRNGPHSDVAACTLHPSHVRSSGLSRPREGWKHRYPTFMHSTTPLLHEVAIPAPTKPRPRPYMNSRFAGTCRHAATTPATAEGRVMRCDCRYACTHRFHA
mmetsp:Transcript_27960/g.70267  ORF Transcript_27960/g.70267 Transcript_27960/m.70267 type:complete len:240 (-) Transcript_27960:368-1087(-)